MNGLQAILVVCSMFISVLSQRLPELITTDPHLQLCNISVPVTYQSYIWDVYLVKTEECYYVCHSAYWKFCGAANAAIGRIGALSREEEIWRHVMMSQLLPVHSYGDQVICGT